MKKKSKILSSLTIIAVLIVFLGTSCSKSSSPIVTTADPHPSWSKLVSSVSFNGPTATSKIVAGQTKLLGTVSIRATGNTSVKLTFIFSGPGANAVESVGYNPTPIGVNNNKFQIIVPVISGTNTINLNYTIMKILPLGTVDGANISVNLTDFNDVSDPFLSLPGSGSLPNGTVTLDNISI